MEGESLNIALKATGIPGTLPTPKLLSPKTTNKPFVQVYTDESELIVLHRILRSALSLAHLFSLCLASSVPSFPHLPPFLEQSRWENPEVRLRISYWRQDVANLPINWICGYVIVGESLLVKVFICELLGCEVLGIEYFLWESHAYNNPTISLDFWNPRVVLQFHVHWHWGTSVSSEGFCLDLVKIDFPVSLTLMKEARTSLGHLHFLNSLFSNRSISGPNSFLSYPFFSFLPFSPFSHICAIPFHPSLTEQN